MLALDWRCYWLVPYNPRLFYFQLNTRCMTLNHYLKYRRYYENAFLVILCLLIIATNATTEILDNMRDSLPVNPLAAVVQEVTSVGTLFMLLPLLFEIIKRVDLKWSNLK